MRCGEVWVQVEHPWVTVLKRKGRKAGMEESGREVETQCERPCDSLSERTLHEHQGDSTYLVEARLGALQWLLSPGGLVFGTYNR